MPFLFIKRNLVRTYLFVFLSFNRLELIFLLRLKKGAFESFNSRQLAISGKCHYIKPGLGYEAGGIFGEVGVNVRLQPH